MSDVLNKGEYNETAWATSLGVLGVLGADALLSNFVKRRYRGNAPDTLVAGWSLVLGSWVYGTVAQFPNNGLAGALSNFVAVAPYALSLGAAVKFLNISNAAPNVQNSLSKKALIAALLSGTAINLIGSNLIKDDEESLWIVPITPEDPSAGLLAAKGIYNGVYGSMRQRRLNRYRRSMRG